MNYQKSLRVCRYALAAAPIILICVDPVLAQSGRGMDPVDFERLDRVLRILFTYLEGSFGALIMVAAGVGAIMSAAIGQYRASLGLLVVAVGAFILRSLVETFFPGTGTALQ